METVLITGGSGLIGKSLAPLLTKHGFTILTLSTKKENESSNCVFWDIEKQELDGSRLKDVEHIIHLAGANIGDKRWTEKQKKLIIDSRIKSAELLYQCFKNQEKKPKTFISASAIGYYGAVTTDHIFTEEDSPAHDFLGNVCAQWEQAALQFESLGTRVVMLRTTVVLSPTGGVLGEITKPMNYGLAFYFGNGKQYFPWIHIDDLCAMYYKAIVDTKMTGAFNAVAPEHITNKTSITEISDSCKRKVFLVSMPSFLLHLLFGDMANLLVQGSRVSSQKNHRYGFCLSISRNENGVS